MNYLEFIDAVAARGAVEPEQASTITDATLRTLAERISGGEAADLAEELPVELQDCLIKPLTQEYAERFGLEEFISRVSRRAGVDVRVANDGVRAVFSTLREAGDADDFQDMMSQLPNEFLTVIEPAGVRQRRG